MCPWQAVSSSEIGKRGRGDIKGDINKGDVPTL